MTDTKQMSFAQYDRLTTQFQTLSNVETSESFQLKTTEYENITNNFQSLVDFIQKNEFEAIAKSDKNINVNNLQRETMTMKPFVKLYNFIHNSHSSNHGNESNILHNRQMEKLHFISNYLTYNINYNANNYCQVLYHYLNLEFDDKLRQFKQEYEFRSDDDHDNVDDENDNVLINCDSIMFKPIEGVPRMSRKQNWYYFYYSNVLFCDYNIEPAMWLVRTINDNGDDFVAHVLLTNPTHSIRQLYHGVILESVKVLMSAMYDKYYNHNYNGGKKAAIQLMENIINIVETNEDTQLLYDHCEQFDDYFNLLGDMITIHPSLTLHLVLSRNFRLKQTKTEHIELKLVDWLEQQSDVKQQFKHQQPKHVAPLLMSICDFFFQDQSPFDGQTYFGQSHNEENLHRLIPWARGEWSFDDIDNIDETKIPNFESVIYILHQVIMHHKETSCNEELLNDCKKDKFSIFTWGLGIETLDTQDRLNLGYQQLQEYYDSCFKFKKYSQLCNNNLMRFIYNLLRFQARVKFNHQLTLSKNQNKLNQSKANISYYISNLINHACYNNTFNSFITASHLISFLSHCDKTEAIEWCLPFIKSYIFDIKHDSIYTAKSHAIANRYNNIFNSHCRCRAGAIVDYSQFWESFIQMMNAPGRYGYHHLFFGPHVRVDFLDLVDYFKNNEPEMAVVLWKFVVECMENSSNFAEFMFDLRTHYKNRRWDWSLEKLIKSNASLLYKQYSRLMLMQFEKSTKCEYIRERIHNKSDMDDYRSNEWPLIRFGTKEYEFIPYRCIQKDKRCYFQNYCGKLAFETKSPDELRFEDMYGISPTEM